MIQEDTIGDVARGMLFEIDACPPAAQHRRAHPNQSPNSGDSGNVFD